MAKPRVLKRFFIQLHRENKHTEKYVCSLLNPAYLQGKSFAGEQTATVNTREVYKKLTKRIKIRHHYWCIKTKIIDLVQHLSTHKAYEDIIYQ